MIGYFLVSTVSNDLLPFGCVSGFVYLLCTCVALSIFVAHTYVLVAEVTWFFLQKQMQRDVACCHWWGAGASPWSCVNCNVLCVRPAGYWLLCLDMCLRRLAWPESNICPRHLAFRKIKRKSSEGAAGHGREAIGQLSAAETGAQARTSLWAEPSRATHLWPSSCQKC